MINVAETATTLYLSGNTTEIESLRQEFKFRPKNFFMSIAYQQYQKTGGSHGWDGFIYPLFICRNGSITLPRGRKFDLFRYARNLGIKIDKSKMLENPLAKLELDDVEPDCIAGKFQLDTRQRQCIVEWLRHGLGICRVSVGGGKTETFAGAAALIKQKFPEYSIIYITQSERLVRQSAQRIRELLPDLEVGQYGGGKQETDARDMVVCTASVLHKNLDRLNSARYFDRFICVMYDECHHAGSPTSAKILDSIPAYYRLGASDTTKLNDTSKYYTIRGLLGPKLFEVNSQTLINENRLAIPHIHVVNIPEWRNKFSEVSYKPALGSSAYVLMDGNWIKGVYRGQVYEVDEKTGNLRMKRHKTAEIDEQGEFIVEKRPVIVSGLHRIEIDGKIAEIESRWCLLERMYDKAIIQFKSRNNLVIEWAEYFSGLKWPTVIVATRTTHVYILESMMKQKIDPSLVKILIGYEDDTPKQRDEMFAWFKSTPGAVLITPLVKEGISINEIRAMVIADSLSDYEVARQIIGRAMRPKKEKNEAHVVWFSDNQHPVLASGTKKVLSYLKDTEGFVYHEGETSPANVQGELF
jgi:superfamily II DNA or RNA helicase